MLSFRRSALLAAIGLVLSLPASAAELSEMRIDWATYNPLSILIKNEGLLEKEFAADGINVRWVQSAGSNKALEFLNAGSLDFGSTAGAAALIARVNGNPIRAVAVYSKPEWTALVTRTGSGIESVADLRGKRVAVTRGTDPHIFLERALADAGLSDKDVTLVLLQHADGRQALVRGDVDAWAGLDPPMASAEIEDGATLFFRKPENNTYGVLNTTESFAAEHPEIVARVLAVYERVRQQAVADPAALKSALVEATRLPEPVIARQLERTDLSSSAIGEAQEQTIREAGIALQKAGVLPPEADIAKVADELVDGDFTTASR